MGLNVADRHLAAYLMETDLLSPSDLLEALHDAEISGRGLGEVLVERGKLSKAEIDSLHQAADDTRTPVAADDSRTPVSGDLPTRRPNPRAETRTYEAADPTSWATSEDMIASDTLPTVPPEEGIALTLEEDVGIAATVRRSNAPSDLLIEIASDDSGATIIPVSERRGSSTKSVAAEDPFREASDAFSERSGFEIKIDRAEDSVGPSGRNLSDRYVFYGEIARGGMGRILKAKDGEIGREVAVKVLLPGRESIENEVRRFWMEVQATGQLEHPSIIPIHDVGRLPSGELFYVMKLLSGRTLGDVLKELRTEPATAGEFPRVRLLTAFQQIAYAIAFAHSRGVIHRDIKPANIMIGRYGEAMLLDWGLAKIDGKASTRDLDGSKVEIREPSSASETADGTITGTPQYMSPEATEGRSEVIGSKSDVYSLGAVLYEILTLKPAFKDEGFMPTLMKVREGKFVPPRARTPEREISRELEELCLLAMHLDPSERPTAKQLADDIGRILEGTREQERRTQEAKLRLSEGLSAVERWKVLRSDLRIAERESRRLAKSVPAWASPEDKEMFWNAEDRVDGLRLDAISAFAEAEAAFLRALGERPDFEEGRGAMASLYYEQFAEAERERDEARKRYYASLVSRYGDDSWERLLKGDGTIRVEADREGVDVYLARFELERRVLKPGPPKLLGTAPIGPVDLPIGSYLLLLRHPHNQNLLVPVRVGRAERVEVSIAVPSEADVGAEFVYVAAGPCILGGDAVAHGALERKVKNLPSFAIARYPVTCGEYLEFLNALASEDPEAAQRHAPRVGVDEGYYWTFDEARECFDLPSDSDRFRWHEDHPVFGVSYRDALAYAAWKAERTGQRLRLPREDEWEKAARGVDGRIFPWGDAFDATFCKMKDSRDTAHPYPEAVGSFVTDCSPYGMYDAAGGVREICETTVDEQTTPVMRGGCWHDTGLFCRLGFRHVTKPDFVNTGLGFRLLKEID